MLVSPSDFSGIIKLPSLLSQNIAAAIWYILGFKEINRLHLSCCHFNNLGYVEAILEEKRIKLSIDEWKLKKIPKNQPLIVLANHPFGCLEGLLLLKIIKKIHPSSQLMVTKMLHKIPNLRDDFIFFDIYKKNKSPFNISSLRKTKNALSNNIPVGIFPSGLVAHYTFPSLTFKEPKWQENIGKLIASNKVNVLPIFFEGKNSFIFQLLGLIHPKLRTALLGKELIKKKNLTIKAHIGDIVLKEELEALPSTKAVIKYLYHKTLVLDPKQKIQKKTIKIAKPIHPNLIEQDIQSLQGNKLISSNNYESYIADYTQIPNIIKEIGRLREYTFRLVGEGSNSVLDIDVYDQYYKHIILFNNKERKIMGAYRLGLGDEIYTKEGINGFYLYKSYDFSDRFQNILQSSIEMGRSWLHPDFQKNNIPLMLLWRSILIFLGKNPQFKYLIGNASISNSYKPFFRDLMVYYLKKHYFNKSLSLNIYPREPYCITTNTTKKISAFDAQLTPDIKSLDKILQSYSNEKVKIPVLIRQYLAINAKIIGFSIDKFFSNCLDCLTLLDLQNIDTQILEKLKKNL